MDARRGHVAPSMGVDCHYVDRRVGLDFGGASPPPAVLGCCSNTALGVFTGCTTVSLPEIPMAELTVTAAAAAAPKTAASVPN